MIDVNVENLKTKDEAIENKFASVMEDIETFLKRSSQII